MSKELVTVEVEIIGSSDMAVKIQEANENTVWLPKSQIDNIQEIEEVLESMRVEEVLETVDGACTEIDIPEWLALDKGLI